MGGDTRDICLSSIPLGYCDWWYFSGIYSKDSEAGFDTLPWWSANYRYAFLPYSLRYILLISPDSNSDSLIWLTGSDCALVGQVFWHGHMAVSQSVIACSSVTTNTFPHLSSSFCTRLSYCQLFFSYIIGTWLLNFILSFGLHLLWCFFASFIIFVKVYLVTVWTIVAIWFRFDGTFSDCLIRNSLLECASERILRVCLHGVL